MERHKLGIALMPDPRDDVVEEVPDTPEALKAFVVRLRMKGAHRVVVYDKDDNGVAILGVYVKLYPKEET